MAPMPSGWPVLLVTLQPGPPKVLSREWRGGDVCKGQGAEVSGPKVLVYARKAVSQRSV